MKKAVAENDPIRLVFNEYDIDPLAEGFFTAINLNRRNGELREENQKLRNDLEVLTAEKERLEAKKESDFMLLGAALVLLGVILALVIPLLKPPKKTDNWA